MISFMTTFLMVLAASVAGVAVVAGVLYVYWNHKTGEGKEQVVYSRPAECISSFSLMAPLTTRAAR
ncbi:MAG: hypothetical protein IKU09_04255 [Firmicutes bacterium]|nr:hypothetical protein [Bacillota bacterium]